MTPRRRRCQLPQRAAHGQDPRRGARVRRRDGRSDRRRQFTRRRGGPSRAGGRARRMRHHEPGESRVCRRGQPGVGERATPTSCSFSIPTSSGSPGAMPTWSTRFAIRAWPPWSPGLLDADGSVHAQLLPRPAAVRPDRGGRRARRPVPAVAAPAAVPPAGLGLLLAATGRRGNRCMSLPAPLGARRRGAVRRTVLRVLRGDGLDGQGEAPRMANRVRSDGRGRACIGRELAGGTVAPVAVAAREPAPVRPKTLRAYHRRGASGRPHRPRRSPRRQAHGRRRP